MRYDLAEAARAGGRADVRADRPDDRAGAPRWHGLVAPGRRRRCQPLLQPELPPAHHPARPRSGCIVRDELC